MSFTTIAIVMLIAFSIAHAINIIALSNQIDFVEKKTDSIIKAYIEVMEQAKEKLKEKENE